MKTDLEQEMALFRYNLIAPLINGTYTETSVNAYCINVAQKNYVLPDGSTRKFSHETIKWWFRKYRDMGFNGLYSKTRSDNGKLRSLSCEIQNIIIEKKKENFRKTATSIYKELIDEGFISENEVSLSAIIRFVGKIKNKLNICSGEDMRAFEMKYANDLWQIDTSHGPFITIDGKKYKTYLIAIIDDASRLIVGYGFYLADNAVNVQLTLKDAILRYGIPKRLYADNGAPYKNVQLSLICANLGISLQHAKAYHGNQKGKIERTFRTIKEGWMYNINYDDFHSPEMLEKSLASFINCKNNTIHSITKKTPMDRFLEDADRIIRKDERIVNQAFMHTIERKVGNDALVRIEGESYETSQNYIGKRVVIRYVPDMRHIYLQNDDGTLKEIFKVNRVENSQIKRQEPLFSQGKEE